ncbi:MAG: oligopeptide transporter, OPT family [Alphaproteobacteria bacterium]|nr:oligopeptide transporter, OPT family [Alphaproteobacteria bacterium]
MKQIADQKIEPYIPASTSLPEITLKAFILGIILSILMAAANAYLVLKVGLSVSACIPAAIISMAVLKMFRNSNILENNIVQTAASAGEVIACALALIIPALIMIGYWNSFHYVIMTSIAAMGGLLGVLLSVPLRRAMVVEGKLKFPEGVATAEVLKAGDESAAAKGILFAGLAAAVVKFSQTGFQIFADSIHMWGRIGNTVVGGTAGFSFAMIGAGYVVGLQVTAAMFTGAIFAWFLGVPLYGAIFGLPLDATDAYSAAGGIWNSKIRIIGVGMMVFGGVWTMIELIPPVRRAISSSLDAIRKLKTQGKDTVFRTDMDIPITYVGLGALFLILPIYFTLESIFSASSFQFATLLIMGVSIVATLLAFILSALGSVISSYMCGLLGTTSNPVSGILIMAIIIISFVFMLLLSPFVSFSADADAALSAAGITILIATLIGCAAYIAGDNLQDLKSGQLVGATPWKQQVMLIVGVLASAIILAPIFQLLFEAYGIGDVLPREGMDPAQALSAPKAALMAALSQAIFAQSMDWTMVTIGMGLGLLIVMIGKFSKEGSPWRLPVLAVAVGVYMPLEIPSALLFGGLLSYFSLKSLNKSKASAKEKAMTERRGILFASGLIAGEAMVGILLAIPFVAYQSTNVFRFVPEAFADHTDVLGLIVTLGVLYWFYQVASKVKKAPHRAHP